MFIRMLKLEATAKSKYDLSSHGRKLPRRCPKEIKHQMMDWWGPILENITLALRGMDRPLFLHKSGWRTRVVGKAHLGVLHICDENGTELAAGKGMVYFDKLLDHLNTTMRLRKPRARHIRQTNGPHLEMSAISTKTAIYS